MRVFNSFRKRFVKLNQLKSYLKYAFGEILLVVLGILIALYINNWNSSNKLKQKELQLYGQLKQQILEDMNELSDVKSLNSQHSRQFEKAIEIIYTKNESNLDSLVLLTMGLSQYSDFHGSGKIFETLVNSGNIELIENPLIPAKLQSLESTYSYLNKLEDIHWEIIMKELSPEVKGVINYVNRQVLKHEKLYGVELQNIFVECLFLTKGKDSVYTKAQGEMNEILILLDQELNE